VLPHERRSAQPIANTSAKAQKTTDLLMAEPPAKQVRRKEKQRQETHSPEPPAFLMPFVRRSALSECG